MGADGATPNYQVVGSSSRVTRTVITIAVDQTEKIVTGSLSSVGVRERNTTESKMEYQAYYEFLLTKTLSLEISRFQDYNIAS